MVAEPAPPLSFGSSHPSPTSPGRRARPSPPSPCPRPPAARESSPTTISPALPKGLSFDDKTFAVSGTPTAASAQATYTYSASDGTTTAALSFKIEVLEGAAQAQAQDGPSAQAGLSWVTAPPTLQEWKQGDAVNVTLPAATGDPSITYHLTQQLRQSKCEIAPRDFLECQHPHPQRHAHQVVRHPGSLLRWPTASNKSAPSVIIHIRAADTAGNHAPYASIKSSGSPAARAAMVEIRRLLQRLRNLRPQQRPHQALLRPGRRHADLHGGL